MGTVCLSGLMVARWSVKAGKVQGGWMPHRHHRHQVKPVLKLTLGGPSPSGLAVSQSDPLIGDVVKQRGVREVLGVLPFVQPHRKWSDVNPSFQKHIISEVRHGQGSG